MPVDVSMVEGSAGIVCWAGRFDGRAAPGGFAATVGAVSISASAAAGVAMKSGAGGVGGSRRRGGWGISPRRRARALSAQTRGPYTVHPWSCDGQEPECSGAHGCAGAAYCKKRPCFIKLPEGRRTHQPPPQRTFVMPPSGRELSNSALVSASSRWVGYLSPAAWVRQGCRPSSSSRDGRSTVHASAWTRWRARRRG